MLAIVEGWCGPVAAFRTLRHNFGAIAEADGPAQCGFVLINAGDAPLTILSANASCGCTTPDYSRKPIAPGDSTVITVAYDPAGRPGRFSQSIRVKTNTQPDRTHLEISGVVIGSEESIGRRYPVDYSPLRLVKPTLALGNAKAGRFKTVYFDGYNMSGDSLRFSFADVPSYLEIVPTPSPVPPGEQVTFIAYVNTAKGVPYGVSEDTAKVTIVGRGVEFALPILINVGEDFTNLSASEMEKAPVAVPSAERIDLGEVNACDGPVDTKFTLKNGGKNPLKIRRIYSEDKFIEASCKDETVKKDKTAQIAVRVDPSQCNGDYINGRLQVITNDPLHPVYTIRIVGTLKKCPSSGSTK